MSSESDTERQLRKELERLRAENKSLRSSAKRSLELRVSKKGAVSLYGLRRFPITLYMEEWARVLSMSDEIQQFIADNRERLQRKGSPKAAQMVDDEDTDSDVDTVMDRLRLPKD